MDSSHLYRKYTRPALGDLLEILGLEIEFQHAEGDWISGKKKSGQGVKAVDFLGGYGSTLIGHNNPEVLKEVNAFFEKKTPIHAQASVRTSTAHLSARLSEMLREELKSSHDFVTTFGNSGAEAVEIALKHAFLQWKNKKRDLLHTLKLQYHNSKNKSLELQDQFFQLVERIENSEPKILAFEGGFHGKTAAAVSVTENPSYSDMYKKRMISVEFLSRQFAPHQVARLLSDSEISFDWMGTRGSFSDYIGLIFEPIQGEGGLYCLPSDLLKEFQTQMQPRGIPLIADEIQSGLYRTGHLTASSMIGIQPDYVLFSKSLGGGVAKISATMIREDYYQYEFGKVHTSTFAEDDLSSQIAFKTVEILSQNKDKILQKARHFSKRVREFSERIQKKFPKVLKEVRGQGFFMGIEFDFTENSDHSSFLKFVYENGYAAYLFTSYLLHHYQIRVGVTLSSPGTIRLEPSWQISDESIEKLESGVENLCQILSERKMAQLMSHLWQEPVDPASLAIISDPATPPVKSKEAIKKIGFLSHVLNINYLRKMERAFTGVHSSDLDRFLNLYLRNSSPALYHEQIVEGINGEKVILNVYGLMISSHQFEADLRNRTKHTLYKVQEAVDLAASDGCEYFGLGQFTSIVSSNGLLLQPSLPLTTGNSLTAGMAYRAVERLIADRFSNKKDLKIGVVGFTGNICLVVSQLLADLNYPMTLVYREPYATSERFKSAVQDLLSVSQLSMEQLTFAHEISAIRDCDVVLVGTNSSAEFILSEHVKPGSVILDISVPTNVSAEVRKRSDVVYFQGGFARFPFDQRLNHVWTPTFGSKNWFACMSETLICGMLNYSQPFSLGPLSKQGVLESLKMADKVGVELGDLRRG